MQIYSAALYVAENEIEEVESVIRVYSKSTGHKKAA
jgi:hypothetical protein